MTQSSYSITPDSSPLNALLEQRAQIDEKIARKRKRLEPTESEKLATKFGTKFVKDIGEGILKKIQKTSLHDFENDSSMVMARGETDDRMPFLAFRIELMSEIQERVCIVTIKIFQTLFQVDDAQYTSPSYIQGDDDKYYPSPILSGKNVEENRYILRDLVEGRKFTWKANPHKNNSGQYESIEGNQIHYFRLMGGVQQ